MSLRNDLMVLFAVRNERNKPVPIPWGLHAANFTRKATVLGCFCPLSVASPPPAAGNSCCGGPQLQASSCTARSGGIRASGPLAAARRRQAAAAAAAEA